MKYGPQPKRSQLRIPEVSKGGFPEFREALAIHESSNNYSCYKPKGPYFGKYQFGRARLIDLGLRDGDDWVFPLTSEKFLRNSILQEAAFTAHVARYLDSIYRRYETKFGLFIDGVKITPSGLVAAAHLVGLGSVNSMIRTGTRPVDGNGTGAVDYLCWMGDYDIPRDMSMTIDKEFIF